MSKHKSSTNGRTTFTLLEMIQALRGFRSPEGYVVIPNDVAQKIEDEITRLYEVEETAVSLAEEIGKGLLHPARNHPLVIAILGEQEEA